MKDLRGNELSVGDTIVVGDDNGSTLRIGTITKLKGRVHFRIDNGNFFWNGNRAYSRVVKLNKEQDYV